MLNQPFRSFLLSLVCIVCMARPLGAQETFAEKHIEVALRKIGHEVLLHANDSTTRVLPVLKQNGQHIIQFETEFAFKPEQLVRTVSGVMKDARIADRYILEVEQCLTESVVYSFEMDNAGVQDIVPCKSRIQPRSCYRLVLTILEPQTHMLASPGAIGTAATSTFPISPMIAGLLSLVGIVAFVVWKRKNNHTNKAGLITLGKYLLDQRNAVLTIEDRQTELSGKEVDLLNLLYSSVNDTVKKETMLHQVWGDEGSYVGRTLDVFISKLRAKLQDDPNVKIVNIRGVGYKLIINDL